MKLTRQDQENFPPSPVHDKSSDCREDHLSGGHNHRGNIAALRTEHFNTHLASVTQNKTHEDVRSTYFEMSLLKDSLGIKHDGIDAGELLEDHHHYAHP